MKSQPVGMYKVVHVAIGLVLFANFVAGQSEQKKQISTSFVLHLIRVILHFSSLWGSNLYSFGWLLHHRKQSLLFWGLLWRPLLLLRYNGYKHSSTMNF